MTPNPAAAEQVLAQQLKKLGEHLGLRPDEASCAWDEIRVRPYEDAQPTRRGAGGARDSDGKATSNVHSGRVSQARESPD